jgi:hypothetical protein
MKLSVFSLGLALVGLSGALTSQSQAAVGDLTTQSTVVISTSYGNAIFTTDFTQPAGTGVFDPFLTIQANGVEQGYNTSAGVFDTKREPQWNHEIQVNDLTKVTINGSEYYSFLIDINEPNSATTSQISLDALKIYTSGTAGQTTTNVDSLGVKRFDLDLPSDSYIKYDDLNSGSGQADIAFFIPTAAFIGAKSTDYVYMYQMFGGSIAANYTTQGGFEETRIGGSVTPVPEITTVGPLAGLFGLLIGTNVLYRRRRPSARAEA